MCVFYYRLSLWQVTTDPRWGRVSENFGEAELLVALMGAAETRGLLVRAIQLQL